MTEFMESFFVFLLFIVLLCYVARLLSMFRRKYISYMATVRCTEIRYSMLRTEQNVSHSAHDTFTCISISYLYCDFTFRGVGYTTTKQKKGQRWFAYSIDAECSSSHCGSDSLTHTWVTKLRYCYSQYSAAWANWQYAMTFSYQIARMLDISYEYCSGKQLRLCLRQLTGLDYAFCVELLHSMCIYDWLLHCQWPILLTWLNFNSSVDK